MAPHEIASKLRAFEKMVGPKAKAYLNVDSRNMKPIYFSLYSRGMVENSTLNFEADTFEECFATAETKWAECSDRFRHETVRKMALAIIRITADQGECTDAALRADGFDAADLLAYSKGAVEDANKIASNGPFSIQKLRGANAA